MPCTSPRGGRIIGSGTTGGTCRLLLPPDPGRTHPRKLFRPSLTPCPSVHETRIVAQNQKDDANAHSSTPPGTGPVPAGHAALEASQGTLAEPKKMALRLEGKMPCKKCVTGGDTPGACPYQLAGAASAAGAAAGAVTVLPGAMRASSVGTVPTSPAGAVLAAGAGASVLPRQ